MEAGSSPGPAVKQDCILQACPLLGPGQRCAGKRKDTYRGSPRDTSLGRYVEDISR